MIYFFTPYDFNKRMFDAWERYMWLVKDDDWVVMMDGDTLMFQANFGHIVQEYIKKYPDTGLFTCYASRSGTGFMMPKPNLMNATNIMMHRGVALKLERDNRLKVKELNDRVTGHFMCIKKETWNKIYSGVRDKCRGLGILSVDTVISRSVLEAGLKIRLMEGLYVLHYYRLGEGPKRKQMLG